MIHIKYCKKCNVAFDIGINFENCPDCRNKKRGEKDEERRINR